MIIPRFWLSQDEKTVTIYIRAPYCSLKDLDVTVEDELFLFTCSPYYLRLKLPGKLEENENFHSSFDSDKGEFAFTYEKVHSGEYFPGLDLITKLLQTKVAANEGNRKIEIVNCESADYSAINKEEDCCQYGFGLRGGYDFKFVSSEFQDVFEIDPFSVNLQERKLLRIKDESEKFSIEHYIADSIENDEIEELVKLDAPWKNLEGKEIQFSDRELDFLKDLVNVCYNLSPEQNVFCRNGLLDILYAYCYDRRTSYFEGTCESGWTICKLSATLCWFEGFLTSKEAITSAFRRSLIYPLYREFNLSQCILADLKLLISLGTKYVIKCLINIYDIFLGGSCNRYVLNNLYIKDYVNYVMQKDEHFWDDLKKELDTLNVKKGDLGLNLINIENIILNDDGLDHAMKQLRLKNTTDYTDSDDTTSDSKTETDSDSETEDD